MKKFVTAFMCFLLMACADPLHTGGKTYEPYGLISESNKADPNVCYEVNTGDLILSIVLIETVLAPILIVGYDIMEPVKLKDSNGSCKTTH